MTNQATLTRLAESLQSLAVADGWRVAMYRTSVELTLMELEKSLPKKEALAVVLQQAAPQVLSSLIAENEPEDASRLIERLGQIGTADGVAISEDADAQPLLAELQAQLERSRRPAA